MSIENRLHEHASRAKDELAEVGLELESVTLRAEPGSRVAHVTYKIGAVCIEATQDVPRTRPSLWERLKTMTLALRTIASRIGEYVIVLQEEDMEALITVGADTLVLRAPYEKGHGRIFVELYDETNATCTALMTTQLYISITGARHVADVIALKFREELARRNSHEHE